MREKGEAKKDKVDGVNYRSSPQLELSERIPSDKANDGGENNISSQNSLVHEE